MSNLDDRKILKNRVLEQETWENPDEEPVNFSLNTWLHVYNAGLLLLSLCLIGYGGYLVNRYNSDFAKIFISMSSFLCLTSLIWFALPYVIPSRIAAFAWAICTAIITIGTLLTFIFSFSSSFYDKAYELDAGSSLHRKQAAIWLDRHKKTFQTLTGIGMSLSIVALLSYFSLEIQNVMGKRQPITSRIPQRRENNNLNNHSQHVRGRDLELNQPVYA